MKYYYYVVDSIENGKQFAQAIKVSEGNNLLHTFDRYSNAVSITPMPTMKHAEEVADMWNETAKSEGRYLYDVRSSTNSRHRFTVKATRH